MFMFFDFPIGFFDVVYPSSLEVWALQSGFIFGTLGTVTGIHQFRGTIILYLGVKLF